MIDKEVWESIKASHEVLIEDWKKELQDPNISEETRAFLTYMVQHMEEEREMTYTSTPSFGGTRYIVKHKRSEPRKMVWEEEQYGWLRRTWRRFTIWLDWWWHK